MVTFYLIYKMTHAEYLLDFKQLIVSLLCSACDEIFSGFITGISMRYDSVPGVGRVVMGQAGPAGGFGGSYPEDISPKETAALCSPKPGYGTWWKLGELLAIL